MNTFLRRLKYYGIGFGIGLLFVFFIFKQKGCSWTPGNRVKEAVLNRIIVADSLDLAFLKGQKISAAGVRTLVQNSSISFSESAIKGDRKTYVLFGELPNGKSLKYLITLHDQDFMVEVDFLHSNPAAFQRTLREGKPLVYKPQKNWFHGAWDTYGIAGFKGADAPEKLTSLFFSKGSIELASSSRNEAKPTHRIMVPYEGKTIVLTGFYYQEKIEVQEMGYQTP
ncbi:MAG: hypothetical protein ACK454_05625 [Flavobacteriales bacterium]|jgi:hypothetical protein